jgi:uncharacterized protein YprB with RNaseH-like and TPR domain
VSGGEAFRERLRRLRRDPPPGAPRELALVPADEPRTPAGGGDGAAWARGLPERLRERLARGAAVLHRRSLGPPRDLTRGAGPRGPFDFRRTLLDAAAVHGDWRLSEVRHASPSDLALLACDPAVERLDPRSAVYLDIETTGLSSGAGTVPFLVCLGRFEGSSFELWQGFLSGPEQEPALLAEVARRIAGSSGVVSFFGKSFDRHRLEDKMRIHGVAPPFAALPHLDLYHPCRRLYGAAFEDGRLATLERGLCGVTRGDDLSGAHAPAAWFDFLAGRGHLCEQVFQHNLLDVLSLVTLAAHLGRALSESRPCGAPLEIAPVPAPACARAAGLARLFARRRDHAQALAWCERARARGADAPELALLRAECLARTGDVAAALEAYRALGTRSDACAARALFEAARLTRGEESRGLLERALALAPVMDLRLRSRVERRLARCSRGTRPPIGLTGPARGPRSARNAASRG